MQIGVVTNSPCRSCHSPPTPSIVVTAHARRCRLSSATVRCRPLLTLGCCRGRWFAVVNAAASLAIRRSSVGGGGSTPLPLPLPCHVASPLPCHPRAVRRLCRKQGREVGSR
ncbi:hypothetical protein ACLOJK_007898 [Asimina triloba]